MYSQLGAALIPGIKKFLIIYVVLALILLILTIVNLALNDWYEYCFWKFGLVSAEPIDSDLGASKKDTIGAVKDAICGSDEDGYDSFCPGVCGNLKGFRDGGAVMIFFSVLALITTLGSGALHVLAIIGRSWKSKLYWVWINLPLGVWLLGTIIYGIVANIGSIDKTKGIANDVKVEGGVGLCIFLVLFHIAVNVYAMIFTRKAFLESNA